MYKETHYYFNGTAFNKLVYDAGYDGIKDFAERSGIIISYKTIKRACTGGQCTKRTYHAIAHKLAETLGWIDPIASLKKAFTSEPKHEEECNDDVSCNYEEVVVCLTNDHCVSVKGKSIYWSWFYSDNTICFYDEGAEYGEDNGDLKIAEFDKAAVLGIIRKFKE